MVEYQEKLTHIQESIVTSAEGSPELPLETKLPLSKLHSACSALIYFMKYRLRYLIKGYVAEWLMSLTLNLLFSKLWVRIPPGTVDSFV
jgi:hypothetical protein